MITIDNSWDISANISTEDSNGKKATKKITGRFPPSQTDENKITAICKSLNDMTDNSLLSVFLTAKTGDISL